MDKKLDYILGELEIKYGPITCFFTDSKGCDHFLYDDDCDWGCKGNAMGN